MNIRYPIYEGVYRILTALGAGKLVLVRQKTFVGQGHNLLCSLEQRILINSDCHATFTQKEVFLIKFCFNTRF